MYLHETKRNCLRAGGPPSAGGTDAGSRAQPSRDRPVSRGNTSLGDALEGRFPAKRTGWAESPASPWRKTQTDQVTNESVTPFTSPRGAGLGISNRSLDPPTNCQGDRETLWSKVSPPLSMVSDAQTRLELSETQAASHPAGPASRSGLGPKEMAWYKKKPAESVKPLFWRMNLVFSSNPPWCVHGPLKELLPPLSILFVGITFLRLVVSRSRLSEDDSAWGSKYINTLLPALSPLNLWRRVCVIFPGESFWCGIVRLSTVGRLCGSCFGKLNVSILNTFPAIHLRSILKKEFGARPNIMNWQTFVLIIWTNSNGRLSHAWAKLRRTLACSVHSSMHVIHH